MAATQALPTDGPIAIEGLVPVGTPQLRWASRASTIDGIERELARIWAEPKLTTVVDGVEVRNIAARTSVMNLVVIAQQSEDGEHGAAIISQLTGRHPSRTMILSAADPDGPGWLDARITAQCILPRADAPEICAEMIYITAGGDTGRHLAAIVEPLLIHDLPVTVWWPGEARLESQQARDVLASADRLVVDGSAWRGDGLARLRELARVATTTRTAVSDFALARQSRWREAIASTFDMPEFLPYLRSLRRVAVTYGTHDESGLPGGTNLVKPLYHVAWLASRLGLTVIKPLAAVPGTPAPTRPGVKPSPGRGYSATLRQGNADIAVVVRPVLSSTPAGTTLRVELLCERRGSELRVDVTAEADSVGVRAWQDGVEILDRRFNAARRTEADLLAEAIEAGGRDLVSDDAVRMAALIAAAA
ncbi:MAG TPA: glucose-6-phosphate dehydrogenase assembly protein OpcA [Candidatus Limnocylindrales bacterium]